MKYVLIFCLFFSTLPWAQINQVDAKGWKQGLWYKNYPGTAIHIYYGTFRDDKPIGVFKYYYETGELKAIVDNKPNSKLSLVKMYFENQALMAEGCYWDQKKDSVWMNYNQLGDLVSVETYLDGHLQGKKIIYYVAEQAETGQLSPLSIANYDQDKLQGNYKEYHPNGKVKLNGECIQGERVGEWIEYYTNGQAMSRVRYKHDQLHGWAYYYDRGGNLLAKTLWRGGIKLEGKDLEMFLDHCKKNRIDPNL